MAEIVPRWEWRTFGSRFGTAEPFFAGLEPDAIQESDELYLLSEGDANVKIRDELVDVKALNAVDSAGLEQWVPVMKAEFPLASADLEKVYDALGLVRSAMGDQLTQEQLLEELGAEPAIREVAVQKRRARHVVGGCTAEVTDLLVEGKPMRTIAVESEDPEAVVAAVELAGLQGFVNTNYSRGLRAIIEDAPSRYAVIDVGTNSVKFHLAERAKDGTWRAVVDRAEVTRLGEGLREGGSISPQAMDRTSDAIAGMVEEAREHGVLAIAAVGTAGLRMAANGADVVAGFKERLGIEVRVISGQEEGRLAYLAVKAALGQDHGSIVVFDTGGGSTQFTFGQDDRVLEQYSLNVGAVRYTERFGLDDVVDADVVEQALNAIAEDLALDDRSRPDALVGMGGTVTNITAVSLGMAAYDPDLVQGATLDLGEIDRQIELYRTTPLEGRRAIVGLQPKRAEVILAGACVVKTIVGKLGYESLIVSDRGLRHGLMSERFGG